MKMIRGDGPRLLVLGGLGGAAMVTALGGAKLGDLLDYQRDAILGGQWWRLLTAHLVHLNGSHLLMNLLAWLAIWFYAGRILNGWQWLLAIVVCAFVTSVGLLWFDPVIGWYVGLSGVLHGLLAATALVRWRNGDLSGGWVLCGLVFKLAWEQLYGPLPGSVLAIGGPVVVDAHLYGAVGGVICSAIILCCSHPLRVPH